MLNRTFGMRASLNSVVLVAAASFGACALAGCEHKERVVDVKTPVGDVQVDKTVKPDGDTTGVEVKAPGVEVNTQEK